MLKNLKKTKSEGFTIIEVMIVLAIAGLIMLIVFLAVPALQRNSRNTQRKNDNSSILSAISTWVSNNNGTLPSSSANIQSALTGTKFGYYTSSSVVYYATSVPTVSTLNGDSSGSASKVTTEDAVFVKGATCNGNTPTTSGASARAYVIVYEIETGGTPSEQCISS